MKKYFVGLLLCCVVLCMCAIACAEMVGNDSEINVDNLDDYGTGNWTKSLVTIPSTVSSTDSHAFYRNAVDKIEVIASKNPWSLEDIRQAFVEKYGSEEAVKSLQLYTFHRFDKGDVELSFYNGDRYYVYSARYYDENHVNFLFENEYIRIADKKYCDTSTPTYTNWFSAGVTLFPLTATSGNTYHLYYNDDINEYVNTKYYDDMTVSEYIVWSGWDFFVEDQAGIFIDEKNFPDEVFREYVKQFDVNRSEKLTTDELLFVTDIDVNNKEISSLKGIEHFVNLKKLWCYGNTISELDISQNRELEILWCFNNKLSKLDVGNNTKLIELAFGGNQLTSVDISKNTKLITLDIESNKITKIDLSKNTSLQQLWGHDNPLESVDISNCPYLVKLVEETNPDESEGIRCWKKDRDINEYDYYLYIDKNVKINYSKEEPEDKVNAFITRCYKIILGRTPDAGGLKTWYNELTSGRKSASEIIDRFVNSPEYLNKNYNYGDSVDILYQAMLGRNADAAGKANWVKKLESGQTLAHVINGFCFSKEFRGLCESYGIRAGFVNIPNTDTTAEGKIKAFVQRCYRIILDREADPSGMQTWYEQLSSGKKAAAEIIDRFVNSPEFSGKNYSHSDSVEILYKAMLGRGSDAAGKANWINKLDAGQPFAVVINGFCVSREFTGICESYGIKPGSVNVQLSGMAEEEALSRLAYNAKAPITKKSETNPNRVEIINPSDTIDLNIGTAVQAVYINEEKAKEFIGRCYKVILGRDASQAELDNWIGQMVNGTKTPDQIARGFLSSNEFKGKNIGNEDLVKILYRVYMNRDADPEGLKTWTEKLNNGTSLNDLLNAFAKTGEFKKVVSEMSK